MLAIAHLNKGGGRRAITRVMGPQEWVARPRAEYLVTEEQGTARRLFLPLKNNLAGDRIGYAFEVVGTAVDGIPTSAVAWSSEPVTTSADEALAAAGKRKASSDAVEFAEDALREGPMDQTKIEQIGAEAGFTPKNLRTARESLGVKTRKEGFGRDGKWVWIPPGGATVVRLVVNNDAATQNPDQNGGDGQSGAPHDGGEHAKGSDDRDGGGDGVA